MHNCIMTAKNSTLLGTLAARGLFAEGFRNSELCCPKVIGLILEKATGNGVIVFEGVLKTRSDVDIEEALDFLQSPAAREAPRHLTRPPLLLSIC